ncbi:MAG TPA: DUF4013 domain-containing protein [Methanocorpusculum sp.]|nr:DUF4013 domain-containing protein [Methanocorpusculum sp.]
MEQAELIASSLTDTKESLFTMNHIGHWFRLFLSIAIPIILGIIVASVILQLIVKPIISPYLICDSYGFTESNLSFILQIMAIGIGTICVFLFPFFQGYLYKVMRLNYVPETQKVLSNFFTGWKVNIVLLFYFIPVIILSIIYFITYNLVADHMDAVFGTFNSLFNTATDFGMTVITVLLLIFLSLFAMIGLMTTARTGKIREGANLKKIVGIIKKIGWYNYILSVVFMAIVFLIFYVIFLGISSAIGSNLVGTCILIAVFIFVMIPVAMFLCRYLSKVYDTAFIPVIEDIEDFDDF